MGRILSVVSNQLALALNLRDSQEIIPSLQSETIISVQSINFFV
jgi:hypothetical protein